VGEVWLQHPCWPGEPALGGRLIVVLGCISGDVCRSTRYIRQIRHIPSDHVASHSPDRIGHQGEPSLAVSERPSARGAHNYQTTPPLHRDRQGPQGLRPERREGPSAISALPPKAWRRGSEKIFGFGKKQ
jgi:hypothetical protein